jgi:predicted aldo/keto reductase-like oxidoreductase
LALKLATKSGAYDVVLITYNYTMAHDQGLLKAIDEAAKSGIGIVAMKDAVRRKGAAESQ